MRKYNNLSNAFGKLMKKKRLEYNYTMADVTRELELLGIVMSRSDIYRIENGKVILKDFELVAMCIVLNVNFKELKDALLEEEGK